MVVREGFEPSKAEPSDLQSDPFGRSGTSPHILVPGAGIEPARYQIARDFKSRASTYSATQADRFRSQQDNNTITLTLCQQVFLFFLKMSLLLFLKFNATIRYVLNF